MFESEHFHDLIQECIIIWAALTGLLVTELFLHAAPFDKNFVELFEYMHRGVFLVFYALLALLSLVRMTNAVRAALRQRVATVADDSEDDKREVS